MLTMKPTPLFQTAPPKPSERSPITKLHPSRSGWWESGLQIGFNVVVSVVAISALVQILPERSSRHASLAQLEADVLEREDRVDRLHERFVYYFDPSQLQSIVREESQKIHPQQRPIVWVDAP
jgi:hypothetical protein